MKRQTSLLPMPPELPDTPRAKLIRGPAELPLRKLSAAEQDERARVLAAMRAARARAKVGDIRMFDGDVCSRCASQRVEEIIDITPELGITWLVRCLKCQPND